MEQQQQADHENMQSSTSTGSSIQQKRAIVKIEDSGVGSQQQVRLADGFVFVHATECLLTHSLSHTLTHSLSLCLCVITDATVHRGFR